MTELILQAWHQTSWLEVVSTGFGLIYVVLAARENPWCWPAAMIGTATGIMLFWDVSLLMESGLNVYYLAMAFYGLWAWQRGSKHAGQLSITAWTWRQHSLALLGILGLTLISGYLLSNNSSASYPFIDSLTTWAAVLSTWMVARKILQNWLYWIAIDSVSVWLFWQKSLYLYSLLFVFYTLIACYGYLNWRKIYTSKHKHHAD